MRSASIHLIAFVIDGTNTSVACEHIFSFRPDAMQSASEPAEAEEEECIPELGHHKECRMSRSIMRDDTNIHEW
jgi:hypothetical protein